MKRVTIALVALAGCLPALAQTSASYKLQEHTFNAGGHPLQGSVLSAAQHRITFDSIGSPVARAELASASYRMDAGYATWYRPPGEVAELTFLDKTTLAWPPERSVGTYALYRSVIASLPGGFGDCFATNITDEVTMDTSVPAAGSGHFYLVTARNRIGEEGPKGFQSNGDERGNPSPCP